MSTDNVLFDDEEVSVDPKVVAAELLAKLDASNIPDKLTKITTIPNKFGISSATVALLFKNGYTNSAGQLVTIEKVKREGKSTAVSLRAICTWILNKANKTRGGGSGKRPLSTVMMKFNHPDDLVKIREFATSIGATVLTSKELAEKRAQKAQAKNTTNSTPQ